MCVEIMGSVVMGSVHSFIETIMQISYTYIALPERTYSILRAIGLLKEEKKNLTRLELDILTLSRKPNRFVFIRNKVSENDGATMDGVAFSPSLLKSHSPRRNIRWKEHFRCLA